MTLAVTDTGAIAWPLRSVTGVQAVRARLLQRLYTVAGERPDDVRVGIPEEWLAGEVVSRGRAEAQIRAQLRADPDVEQIRSLQIVDSGAQRSISAVLSVRTVDGLVDLTIGEPLPYSTRGAPAAYMTGGLLRGGRGPAWTGR